MIWSERESRRIEKARSLIRSGVPDSIGLWADLGCGDGIFTSALSTLQPASSEIYAIDRDQNALKALARNFAESYPDAILHTQVADFTRPIDLPPLDGILMANSLHFVHDKVPTLDLIQKMLKLNGRLIVVEYNTDRGNSAVPYPISDKHFLKLAQSIGLRKAQIINRIPSSFLGEMYAALSLA
jgi:ubiquinone/menaquinone biosynthesis C-methylase UbiE